MKVVKNKITGRLVYSEEPEFKEGYGILNAVNLGLGGEEEFEEVEVTQKEWDEEIKLRADEEPPTLQEQIEKLDETLAKFDERVKKIEAKKIEEK